jgi:hypothetical protein
MISGFSHDGDEICNLLGFYSVQSGNSVQTFWDNLSVPFSGDIKSKKKARTFRYAVYTRKIGGSDRFSVNVMPGNRVDAV